LVNSIAKALFVVVCRAAVQSFFSLAYPKKIALYKPGIRVGKKMQLLLSIHRGEIG
jgi:hypothetical protein